MEDVFVRELVIFAGVCALFIGSVPMLLKGYKTQSIDALTSAEPVGAAAMTVSQGDAEASGGAQVRVSKKRRARARDGGRK